MRAWSKISTKEHPAMLYEDCPAKTFQQASGTTILGRSVFNHCQIVGLVAQEIIQRCFPAALNKLFPEGSALLAALHDLGKVSPTFAEKLFRATDGYEPNSRLELKAVDPDLERQWGGHAGVSQAELSNILPFGWTPAVAGQHHGYLPNLQGKNHLAEPFGGKAWHEQRVRLLKDIQDFFGQALPDIRQIEQARLVSGLTTVADWIGSGVHFSDPSKDWSSSISKALDDACITPLKIKKGLSFTDFFPFSPNSVQTSFFQQVQGPGLYILEAPMGLGKTEAALYAAYKMIESEQARGIYFALPTRLTSNKIHERVSEFSKRALEGNDVLVSPMLLHGSAWFMISSDMGEDAGPGGSWFHQNKRGILAPLAVGTVDQALMAVMNVKHGFVRTFGLAGKVVILDEVHSYDTYTGTILNSLIRSLLKLKCTVIVLSATLNQSQKTELLGTPSSKNDYPLITSLTEKSKLVEIHPGQDALRFTQVEVTHTSDEINAEKHALDRAMQGQQVLWIENTVAEAQARYLNFKYLAEDMNLECGLIHSRFTPADRQKNENYWVEVYGKGGSERRKTKGRILIGTQVLEQSIDIDADYLVLKFCPTDMLLQRLGRLWRHANTHRPSGAKCEVCLIEPKESEFQKNIKISFGKSSFVYSPYVMYRSFQVWKDIPTVQLPRDIRTLIDRTYDDQPHASDEVSQLFSELENGEKRYGQASKPGRKQLRQLASNTLTAMGVQANDEQPPTRYSNQEIVNVLLIKDISRNDVRKLTTITLLNGETLEIPWNKSTLSRQASRKIAATLANNTLTLSPQLTLKSNTIAELKSYFLQNALYIGNLDNNPETPAQLRVLLVNSEQQVTDLNRGSFDSNLFYRDDLGYWKKEGIEKS